MELTAGKVAVVTGAASGIGLALAERFARAGLDVVLADVEQPALRAAAEKIAGLGGRTLAVPTDVSDEAAVSALAAAAIDRFGAVHVVCNNAGVASLADPWFGPLSAWKWVLGVNLWGVIHGIRAFLPLLAAQGEGHIVNTASVAGLIPGIGPVYDASKHAVVAISEDLYQAMNVAMLPVGVSVLCPGWVRTSIAQADRNWSQSLGEVPARAATAEVTEPHVQRAIDEGMAPAAVADLVADAITANRFWVFTDARFTQVALTRWQQIAEGRNPESEVDLPGMPPGKQLVAEIQQLLAGPGGALWRATDPLGSRYRPVFAGPGSAEVFRVSRQEREEVAGDVPEDADDEPGREVGFRIADFGRELHPHLPGPGDDGGCDALAQAAQALAHHLRVHRPVRYGTRRDGRPRPRVAGCFSRGKWITPVNEIGIGSMT